ncbi:hypothetical protein DFR59_1262 [Falsibacillus pallidus]|uniref:Uncharacterized protein n=1 Tax=Falsibacillus pallidus TaxID=493781 RepID=A0A370G1A7_9BACI|nr:hypothetical protein DFR59_1262 [Falsibacillus pallidus]
MGEFILNLNKWSNNRGKTPGISPLASLYAPKIPAYDSNHVAYARKHLAYAPAREGYASKPPSNARVAISAPIWVVARAD